MKPGALFRSKLFIGITAGVVAAAAAVTAFVMLKNSDAYRVIKVFDKTGTSLVNRPKLGNIDTYTGMNLQSGDKVYTFSESTMHINLDDTKYLMMEENTELDLEVSGNASDNKTRIVLISGAILNEITKPLSADSTYEVAAPKATMAVHGTSFRVAIDKDSHGEYIIRLYTLHGEVKVTLYDENGDPTGQEAIVGEDKCVIIKTVHNSHSSNDPAVDGYSFFVFEDGSGGYVPVEDGEDPRIDIDYDSIPYDTLKTIFLSDNDNEIKLYPAVLDKVIAAMNKNKENDDDKDESSKSDDESSSKAEKSKSDSSEDSSDTDESKRDESSSSVKHDDSSKPKNDSSSKAKNDDSSNPAVTTAPKNNSGGGNNGGGNNNGGNGGNNSGEKTTTTTSSDDSKKPGTTTTKASTASEADSGKPEESSKPDDSSRPDDSSTPPVTTVPEETSEPETSVPSPEPEPDPEPAEYRVSFYDYDKNLLYSTAVEEGSAAEAPDNYTKSYKDSKTGYTMLFVGWDTDFSNVQSDMEIYPVYKEKTRYTVKFLDYDGSTLSSSEVEEGGSVSAPANYTKAYTDSNTGYTMLFSKWDSSFANVTDNMTIKPVYKEKARFYVTFYDYNDTQLDKQNIEQDKDAKAPTNYTVSYVDTVSGWTMLFEKWDTDFTNVQKELDVKPVYKEKARYTVTFLDYDGSKLDTQTVEKDKDASGPETVTQSYPDEETGRTMLFDKWDTDFTNVQKDLTVKPEYKEKARYTVTFYENTETEGVYSELSKQEIEVGDSAEAPEEYSTSYIDEDSGVKYLFVDWDKPFNEVSEDLDVYATYTEAPKFKVTFYDEYLTALEPQNVYEGEDAVPPELPEHFLNSEENIMVFVDWDTDYTEVYEDLQVKPIYKQGMGLYLLNAADGGNGTDVSPDKLFAVGSTYTLPDYSDDFPDYLVVWFRSYDGEIVSGETFTTVTISDDPERNQYICVPYKDLYVEQYVSLTEKNSDWVRTIYYQGKYWYIESTSDGDLVNPYGDDVNPAHDISESMSEWIFIKNDGEEVDLHEIGEEPMDIREAYVGTKPVDGG